MLECQLHLLWEECCALDGSSVELAIGDAIYRITQTVRVNHTCLQHCEERPGVLACDPTCLQECECHGGDFVELGSGGDVRGEARGPVEDFITRNLIYG